MSKLYYFVFLAFYIACSSSIIFSNNSKLPEEELRTVVQEMLNVNSLAESGSNLNLKKEINIEQFRYIPSNEEKLIFEKALQKAPEKIKSILKIEKDLKFIFLRSNWLLLVGEPGTGKSTLAKAIGCKLGNCYFVTSGDLTQAIIVKLCPT